MAGLPKRGECLAGLPEKIAWQADGPKQAKEWGPPERGSDFGLAEGYEEKSGQRAEGEERLFRKSGQAQLIPLKPRWHGAC